MMTYEMLSSPGRRKLHKILPASGGIISSLTEYVGLGLTKSLLIGFNDISFQWYAFPQLVLEQLPLQQIHNKWSRKYSPTLTTPITPSNTGTEIHSLIPYARGL